MHIKPILLASAFFATIASGNAFASSAEVSEWRDGLSIASQASSYACTNRFSDDVNQRLNSIVPDVCGQLNYSNDPSEYSQYRVDSPQASCDLGLSLPGLPSFDGIGFDASVPDACSIARSIVGDSIRDLNNSSKSAVEALESLLNQNFSFGF